jgi:hypothetical protein
MTNEAAGLIPLIEENIDGPVRLGAELGVFKGKTSACLLKHFPQVTLIMVDTWAPAAPCSEYRKSGDGKAKIDGPTWNRILEQVKQVTEFAAGRRKIWRGDVLKLHKAVREPLDFIFVDAEHTYEATKAAIRLWLPHVRMGGLVAGHDYRESYPGVIKAVDEAVVENDVMLLKSTSTVWGFVRGDHP